MTAGNQGSASRRAHATIFGLFLITTVGIGQATLVALADPPVEVPGPPSADGVQPVIADTRSSDDDCLELDFDRGISIGEDGPASSDGLAITVGGYNDPTGVVDWSSNLPIQGVYVKGGPSGGNLFTYPGGDTGDRDLHTPQRSGGGYDDVGHVAFCWNEAPPEPDVVIEKSNDPTAPPDLQVTKTSSAAGALEDGDDFVYTITVENAGDETATGVEIHDALPTGLDVRVPPLPSFVGDFCTVASSVIAPGVPVVTVDCGPASLEPGGSTSVDIHVRVNGNVCGSITNVADVEGSNEPSENVGPDNHSDVSDEVACVPKIRLLKRGPSRAHVGDTITYVFNATNNGGVPLTGVELTDPKCGGSPTLVNDADGDATLMVGETWTYACDHTITDTDGDPAHNEATLSAGHEGGTVSDSATHDVDVLHPGIRIVKTASPNSGPPGTLIVYTYAVTNTGDTNLFGVSVDDDIEGHIGDISRLEPGKTVEVTYQVSLESSPITNVGSADGADAIGGTVSDTDDATVTVVLGGSNGDDGGTGGSPFTGAGTGRLTALMALFAALGTILLTTTRRRREASE